MAPGQYLPFQHSLEFCKLPSVLMMSKLVAAPPPLPPRTAISVSYNKAVKYFSSLSWCVESGVVSHKWRGSSYKKNKQKRQTKANQTKQKLFKEYIFLNKWTRGITFIRCFKCYFKAPDKLEQINWPPHLDLNYCLNKSTQYSFTWKAIRPAADRARNSASAWGMLLYSQKQKTFPSLCGCFVSFCNLATIHWGWGMLFKKFNL